MQGYGEGSPDEDLKEGRAHSNLGEGDMEWGWVGGI